jgi:hypothetical protein
MVFQNGDNIGQLYHESDPLGLIMMQSLMYSKQDFRLVSWIELGGAHRWSPNDENTKISDPHPTSR